MALGEDFRDETQEKRAQSIEQLLATLTASEANQKSISLSTLLEALGTVLVDLFESRRFPEYDVDRLVSSLPLLHTGLSVDPILTDVTFPPDDLASVLFGVFSLPFKHGWCVDPAESPQISAFFAAHPTFDTAQDVFVLDPESHLDAKEWLAANRSQLTKYGLGQIDASMAPGEFCVFFRNNHFSTLYKRGPADLYLLVTDEGFDSHRRIVWQSFNSVSGKDELFFAGDFEPVVLGAADQHGEPAMSDDYRLMRQLQEEDDLRMARRMQKQFNLPPAKEGRTESQSKETRRKKDNKKPEKLDKKEREKQQKLEKQEPRTNGGKKGNCAVM